MKFIYSQGKQLPCGLISRASSTIVDKVLAYMARRFLAQHLVHSSLLPGTFMLAQGLVYSTSLYFAHWDSLFFFFPTNCSADSVDISPVLQTILRVSYFLLCWCFLNFLQNWSNFWYWIKFNCFTRVSHFWIHTTEGNIFGGTFLISVTTSFLTTWPATTKAYTSQLFNSFAFLK